MSNKTLYMMSRSVEKSVSLLRPITAGKLSLSLGKYCLSLAPEILLSSSMTEICSAKFFNCLMFPGKR